MRVPSCGCVGRVYVAYAPRMCVCRSLLCPVRPDAEVDTQDVGDGDGRGREEGGRREVEQVVREFNSDADQYARRDPGHLSGHPDYFLDRADDRTQVPGRTAATVVKQCSQNPFGTRPFPSSQVKQGDHFVADNFFEHRKRGALYVWRNLQLCSVS